MAAAIQTRLFESNGSPVDLGEQIGAGGQGAVCEVRGRPEFVAKVYFAPPNLAVSRKLAIIPKLGTPGLAKIAAWPTGALFDRPQGHVRGLLMPRVVGHREVHELYSPAHRKQEFPRATWKFLIHAARNLAAAVETIHAHGHVIGDVNQKGFLVSPANATVRVIDCDSFQVNVNGEHFGCPVGVGHFTPPELQGKTFDGLQRTRNHDNFGLAVLCFHLLFSGRHPFVGRFRGQGDMPVERAIAEFRFAFGSQAAEREMEPPPNAIRLAHVSHEVASLFEKAFSRSSVTDTGRPSASDWVAVLDSLEHQVGQCAREEVHWYLPNRGPCPWCEIERTTGSVLFLCWEPGVARPHATSTRSGFNLDLVWAEISAVASPGAAPVEQIQPMRAITATPAPPAFWVARIALGICGGLTTLGLIALGLGHLEDAGLFIGGFGAMVGLVTNYWYSNFNFLGERERRTKEFSEAKSDWESVVRVWTKDASDIRFAEARAALDAVRRAYMDLPSAHAAELKRLEDQKRAIQLTRFLERHFIDRAQLKNIGPARKATLASYGIETAADVQSHRILGVHGFGPAFTQELLGWRARVEAKFRFDPSKAIDPQDKSLIDARYVRRRRELEDQLLSGASDLEHLRRGTLAARSGLWGRMRQARTRLSQAEADAAALGIATRA